MPAEKKTRIPGDCIYEIPEQTKFICCDRNKDNGCLWKRETSGGLEIPQNGSRWGLDGCAQSEDLPECTF